MLDMLLQLYQVNSSSYAVQPTDGPFHPLQEQLRLIHVGERL
jgi:hypothetical protein